MDHHGFMTGMMLGGVLVASVPTLLVIGVGVYVLRHQRALRGRDRTGDVQTEEVSQ